MYQQQYQQYPQYSGYGQQQPVGFSYAPRPQPRCTQPVTAEMSKMLHQESNDLSVKISKTDSIRNQCTHKEPGTNHLALITNPDGSVTCRTCGASFNLIENPKEEIEAWKNKGIDILQTIKTLYLDAPEDFVKEFFQIISLIDRVPAIYDKAAKNFSMYEVYTGAAMPINGGFNTFGAVNSMIGGVNPMAAPGMAYGAPMYQQPMYPQQPMQPQYAPQQYAQPMQPQYAPQPQQPMYQPGFTQPGYQAAPPQGMVPDMNNPMSYSSVPTAAPAPTGPAAQQPPVAQPTQEVQQTKTFQV